VTALAGYWSFADRPRVAADCERMLRAQSIYGQESRQWTDGIRVGMGRRLYRTLPEDIHDRGPIVGGDGSLVLAADVRLDNRAELARSLGIGAHTLGSLCDAALLMQALERWGEHALDRLVGDFAFALWDEQGQRLLLARDFMGRRPLHYHRGKTFFAFASMPKGLHCLDEIPYAPDIAASADFLALLPEAGPRTFFESICRVEPGSAVVVTQGRLETRVYWQPGLTPLALRGHDAYVEALRERLDEAVAARLRGAGDHVGAHLSAGFDSSAVATTAARLMPGASRVTAFTAVPRTGFSGTAPKGRLADEGPLAALTAACYPNMEHVRISTEGRSPLDALSRNFHLYERPLPNLCNSTWANAIKDAARDRGLKVLLNAEMGNLTLSYSGEHLLPQLLSQGRMLRLAREVMLLRRRGTRLRTIGIMTLGPWLPATLWAQIARIRGTSSGLASYSLLRESAALEAGVPQRADERGLDLTFRPRKDAVEARLWALRRVDSGAVQKGNLAGWGIDGRDPTADRRLVEFCLRVPLDQYLKRGEFRALGRRALEDRVPSPVLDERRKGYQAADWREGLAAAGTQVQEEAARLDASAPAEKLIDVARLQSLAATFPVSDCTDAEIVRTYRLALLRGVSAGHFLRSVTRPNG
jgi:asparagine synthase (glutamine-hydrolysing)